MYKIAVIAAIAALTLSAAPAKHPTHGHEFAPINNKRIPVNSFTGITEEEFTGVLDKVFETYEPVFTDHKAKFIIERYWDDETVNAYAFRDDEDGWHIAMYGGLARHPEVTVDGFMLVACHEIGHHLGGFPRSDWASNEGNSDYYGTLKCLRRMWANEDSIKVVEKMDVDTEATEMCEQQWQKAEEIAVCERSAMAGKSLGRLLADLGGEEMPEFDTPDESVVNKTNNQHPAAQCRLDTYFHGSLCTVDWQMDMDESDPNIGACKAGEIGGRRQCWFKEGVQEEEEEPTPEEEEGGESSRRY
jgi:hypothetical protein